MRILNSRNIHTKSGFAVNRSCAVHVFHNVQELLQNVIRWATSVGEEHVVMVKSAI